MRTYEALYIVKPDLSDDEIQTVVKAAETLITNSGGTIVRSEVWGKRKLAYEVKHFTEGVYVLVRFQSEPSFVARLETHFRLSEAVIRDLVVLFDERTLRLEAEQQQKIEAELQAGASGRSDRPGREHGRRRRGDDDSDDGDDVDGDYRDDD